MTSEVERLYEHFRKSLTALGYNDMSSLRATYVGAVDAVVLALSKGETIQQIMEAANRIDGRLV